MLSHVRPGDATSAPAILGGYPSRARAIFKTDGCSFVFLPNKSAEWSMCAELTVFAQPFMSRHV